MDQQELPWQLLPWVPPQRPSQPPPQRLHHPLQQPPQQRQPPPQPLRQHQQPPQPLQQHQPLHQHQQPPQPLYQPPLRQPPQTEPKSSQLPQPTPQPPPQKHSWTWLPTDAQAQAQLQASAQAQAQPQTQTQTQAQVLADVQAMLSPSQSGLDPCMSTFNQGMSTFNQGMATLNPTISTLNPYPFLLQNTCIFPLGNQDCANLPAGMTWPLDQSFICPIAPDVNQNLPSPDDTETPPPPITKETNPSLCTPEDVLRIEQATKDMGNKETEFLKTLQAHLHNNNKAALNCVTQETALPTPPGSTSITTKVKTSPSPRSIVNVGASQPSKALSPDVPAAVIEFKGDDTNRPHEHSPSASTTTGRDVAEPQFDFDFAAEGLDPAGENYTRPARPFWCGWGGCPRSYATLDQLKSHTQDTGHMLQFAGQVKWKCRSCRNYRNNALGKMPDPICKATTRTGANCCYEVDWPTIDVIESTSSKLRPNFRKDRTWGNVACANQCLRGLGYGPSVVLDCEQPLPERTAPIDAYTAGKAMQSLDHASLEKAQILPLIDKFFLDAFTHCPILTRDAIYKIFDSWIAAREKKSPVSKRDTYLVLTVLACAEQNTNLTQSKSFQSKATRFQDSNDFSMTRLQAHMLHCLWFRRCGQLQDSLDMLKRAYRVSLRLGIHQADGADSGTRMERETERWIWWIMVFWDWETSQILGTPKIIDTDNCFVEAPYVPLDYSQPNDSYLVWVIDLQRRIRAGENRLATHSAAVVAWEELLPCKPRADVTKFGPLYLEVIKLMTLVAHLGLYPVRFHTGASSDDAERLNDIVKAVIALIKLVNTQKGRMDCLFHLLFASASKLYNCARSWEEAPREGAFLTIRNAYSLLVERRESDNSGEVRWMVQLTQCLEEIIKRGPKPQDSKKRKAKASQPSGYSRLAKRPARCNNGALNQQQDQDKYRAQAQAQNMLRKQSQGQHQVTAEPTVSPAELLEKYTRPWIG